MKYNNDFDYKQAFFNEEYDECINCFLERIKEEQEDLNLAFYALLSAVGNNDLYLGLSIEKKSKLLNSETIKSYLDKEAPTLVNLLVEKEDVQKVVIVMMFIDSHKDCDVNEPETGLSYFEMISSLYEIGYSSGLIKELTSIGHMLFKM